jgi:hypothetical protein
LELVIARSWIAFPELVNVATPFVDDVVPIAVAGNEKAAGATVNCVEAGAGVAPTETEPEEGVEVVALGATGGMGTL